ncbi:alpha-E domain-containing protein [Motiliproteus sp. SC1-56]|uniref:alpha-E domain-containing protein n=1 Tax=Motiliproteus sp. SC1-56 TaxID=2799565 RepID=UPI001A8F821D|nr:alpha-E domain-containing protein [Motiliproteus sp. SC1-56]
MLSKVAERLYWTSRYLERAENTARLVSVYDALLFDLPREIDISWYNLVELNGAQALFEERYRVQDERNVVKFTLADDTNPSSMLSALNMARENVRTSRDVLPPASWELINELRIFANANIQNGINRSARYEFLDHVVKACQQITGLFSCTMSRDASWQFITIGRHLERVDMVTRLLDAGAAAQIQGEAETNMAISQVIWGNVLRSSSADLAYRRTTRSAVSAQEVAAFLLQDPDFPRSVRFGLAGMRHAASRLPHGRDVVGQIDRQLEAIDALDVETLLDGRFRDFLNEVQLDLIDLHQRFGETWFSYDEPEVA